MKLILIALETRLKSINFRPLLFFCRVKLVLLVLLGLVAVLEREENLALRVMLGHLGLRYTHIYHIRTGKCCATCPSQSPARHLV